MIRYLIGKVKEKVSCVYRVGMKTYDPRLALMAGSTLLGIAAGYMLGGVPGALLGGVTMLLASVLVIEASQRLRATAEASTASREQLWAKV